MLEREPERVQDGRVCELIEEEPAKPSTVCHTLDGCVRVLHRGRCSTRTRRQTGGDAAHSLTVG